MTGDFKPNIYPIIYWGLMYGLIAGFVLFIVAMLSRYLILVWFPIFIAGVVWGGYRNYKKQKGESGQAGAPKPVMEEFKEAAKDIMGATKEMVSEQIQEAAEKDAAEQEATTLSEEEQVEAADTILEEEAELVSSEAVEESMVQQPETVTPPVAIEVPTLPAQPDERETDEHSEKDTLSEEPNKEKPNQGSTV